MIAQGSAAVISLTYTVDDGSNFNTTYSRNGLVNVANLTCYFERNGYCPPEPISVQAIAHAYGETALAPVCGGYDQLSTSKNPRQMYQYYCRRNPDQDSASQEFAYRFQEVNPQDKQRLYPHFTDRIIRASSGECLEYPEVGTGKPTTFLNMSALELTYRNGSTNGSIAIPTASLASEGTTYIYRGRNRPAKMTDFSCGDRCIKMWAYRSSGGGENSSFFECPITVTAVSNARREEHEVPPGMAKLAAASIALQGRDNDPTPDTMPGKDFTQFQFYAAG
ncbi:MAG: hypothetical protein Q9167_004885 [Letrouitia subvulpina]